jgi:hypothetical protein
LVKENFLYNDLVSTGGRARVFFWLFMPHQTQKKNFDLKRNNKIFFFFITPNWFR